MDREVLWINYKSVQKHLKNYWKYSIELLLAKGKNRRVSDWLFQIGLSSSDGAWKTKRFADSKTKSRLCI